MSWRSVSSVGDASSTSLAVPRPAGAAADDILIMSFHAEDLTLTPSLSPGSWTKINGASGEQTVDVTAFERHVYWSRQGAESGDITISWGGANIWNSALCAAFSGRFTSGDPQDGTATYSEASTPDFALIATGLTTGNANADLVAMGGCSRTVTYAWATLTERFDGLGGSQGFAEGTQVGAGASGNKTATMSGGTAPGWTAGLVALRAAGGGAAFRAAPQDPILQAVRRASVH